MEIVVGVSDIGAVNLEGFLANSAMVQSLMTQEDQLERRAGFKHHVFSNLNAESFSSLNSCSSCIPCVNHVSSIDQLAIVSDTLESIPIFDLDQGQHKGSLRNQKDKKKNKKNREVKKSACFSVLVNLSTLPSIGHHEPTSVMELVVPMPHLVEVPIHPTHSIEINSLPSYNRDQEAEAVPLIRQWTTCSL